MVSKIKKAQTEITDSDYVRMYYEHQYDRIERNENHRLTVSNYVLTLSALAFTFGFQNGQQLTIINGLALPLIVIIANLAAITNVDYTAKFIDIHRNRAHEILSKYAPELSGVDEKNNIQSNFLNRRRKIEKIIHQLLILIAFLPLFMYFYQTI
jgi:hypothetical protein